MKQLPPKTAKPLKMMLPKCYHKKERTIEIKKSKKVLRKMCAKCHQIYINKREMAKRMKMKQMLKEKVKNRR